MGTPFPMYERLLRDMARETDMPDLILRLDELARDHAKLGGSAETLDAKVRELIEEAAKQKGR